MLKNIAGKGFLKRVELYSEARSWDKRYQEQKKRESKNPALWELEKKIIKWVYLGHKFEGSQLQTKHIALGDTENKLGDFGVLDEEGGLKPEFKYLKNNVRLNDVFKNLVKKGLASVDFKDASRIEFTEKGVLLSEIYYEISQSNFKRFIYWWFGLVYSSPILFIILLILAFVAGFLF